MHPIRAVFQTLGKLPDEAWNDFEKILYREQFSRNEFLIREGEKCDFIAFVLEGACRFYYLKDGEEKVTAFFFQHDFVTNYRSFLTEQPSDHFMESMGETVVLKFYKKDLDNLYDKHWSIERIGRRIAENLYLTITRRLDSFMYETPEDRYRNLIQRNSDLLHLVPQYMIASYLGVKPETLSRIRKRK